MTHHRPKSPSPTRLPAVPVVPLATEALGTDAAGDTLVDLDPVPEKAEHLDLSVGAAPPGATSPDLALVNQDVTPLEPPPQLRVPGLNQTTPGTPLAMIAPPAAKMPHSDLHKALAPTELSKAEPSVPNGAALGPTFDPLPASEPVKKRESGPRRSQPELPVARKSRSDAKAIDDVPTGPPRKSLTDAPAVTLPPGKKPTHEALPAAGAPRGKSKADLPATALPSHTLDAPPPQAPDAVTGPLPAAITEPAAVRKSRELPRAKSPGSGERAKVLPSPVPDIALSEPLPTPKMMEAIDVTERPTSPKTLPQVPPVLPFGGVEDPRFKRGAMAVGVLAAVVMMAVVSWELLKHEPSMPPESAPRPVVVELPAPPREDSKDVIPQAVAPPKPLQLEIQTDAGPKMVVAGTLNVWCDPDANVFVDGRDLGFTPTHSILPAGKVTFALVNNKIGLHKVETIELKPGENKNVTYHFNPGFLEVLANDDAKLTIDGKPISNRTMQVWEGSHKVEATYGHDKVSLSTEVLPGETTTVELRPQ